MNVLDFHLDEFYRPYTSTAEDYACHRGKGPAGFFGAETSDCDTPMTLLNATFRWINENLKGEIDFVIWTGDSARHDSDGRLPRTTKEVLDLNTVLVDKFTEVFGMEENINDTDPTKDMIIPIVPTFGNNDILPHNIMYSGPNYWTKHFSKVWEKFIPEHQRHGFEQGGGFVVDVIPNKLAVFSLNTLFFFDSNSAVDGCATKCEPGYEQMEWLKIQLQFLRERGMKAIISGHVPPARTESKQSWDETCWQKYALWMQQYRDVVVGSVYGHMNIDHFMLQDFKDIKKKTRKGRNIHVEKNTRQALNDDTLTAQSKTEYLSELRVDWSQIPDPPESKRKSKNCRGFFCELVDYVNELKVEWAKIPEQIAPTDFPQAQSKAASCGTGISELSEFLKEKMTKRKKSKKEKYLEKIGGEWGERYSLSFVSPSVVPNYYPTLRVVEYNISGIDTVAVNSDVISRNNAGGAATDSTHHDFKDSKKSKKKKKKHHKKKPDFTIPTPPSASAPPGPAYSPQTLSWLGYTQYFANLTVINNDFPEKSSMDDDDDDDDLDAQKKWREGKHSGKHPKNDKLKKHHVPFKFDVEYNTQNDSIWGLKDMTVRSYLDLARRIAKYRPSTADSELQSSSFEGKQVHPEEDEGEVDEIATYAIEGDQQDDQFETNGRKKSRKRKHKKKHGNGKQKRINRTWFTFVKRAFVGAVDDEALREEFGLL